jgi:hypothetical protein
MTLTDKERLDRIEEAVGRIEQAVGSLALIVAPHLPVRWKQFPALSNLAAKYREAHDALEREKQKRLDELEREREAIERKVTTA